VNGTPPPVATELMYVALLFALFVVPRVLQRWRLPSAITSLALGAAAGIGFGLFAGDQTIQLLSSFGIVSLFLFAGLEVDGAALRGAARTLLQHLAIRIALFLVVTLGAAALLGLEVRPAALVALALLTPSTGFILNSLSGFGLSADERAWVKSKAIATELLALAVLFVVLQSASVGRLVLAAAALVAMIAVLPLLFRAFAALVAPYAPKSEFAFLLMLATVAAYATRHLGVYYLVGAFITGVAARRFREHMPALASEQMLHAVEVFASFFVPFYFFHAGLMLRREDFSSGALLMGAVFLVIGVGASTLSVVAHRRAALGEPPRQGLRVALAMVPTLVFTLVLAEILLDRFYIRAELFGGLIVYTIANTLLPGFVLRSATPVFDAPVLSDVRPNEGSGPAPQ
jgi:Kef-type K+ transport system membrane component KefB